MKYKRLHQQELEALKDEFIAFLASQGIQGEEWEKMKTNENDKAISIIDIFSDLIWQKVLDKKKYAERLGSDNLELLYFDEQEAKAIILRSSEFDFKNEPLEKVIHALKENRIEVFKGNKKYKKLREQELFDHIEKGAYLTEGQWYNALNKLL